MIIAITGATGFVGSALLDQALTAGHTIRALTRRPQPPRPGVTWIEGDLARPGTLAQDADVLVHVAGVVNAPDRAGFVAGNIDGTATILAAVRAAGVERLVHVSSLSAREPQLSTYGWSKRVAERLVEGSGVRWSIVRPAAVYGPGDVEMRDLFRAAARGIAVALPGRMSAVHVHDLARLLLRLAEDTPADALYEVDDGIGWSHANFGRAVGVAVGRRVTVLPFPVAALRAAAWLDRWFRGSGAKLTSDRAGYLAHPDWVAAADRRVPAHVWEPHITAAEGLASTARWYRDRGLL